MLLTVPEMPVRLNADVGIADVQLLPLEGNALLIVQRDTETALALLREAQRYHRVLAAADFPTDKITTVLNRADSAGPSAAEVSAALGRQFEAVLPNDPVVDREGQGFTAGSPDPAALVSGSFEHLAGVVLEKVTGVGAESIAVAA